MIWILSFSQTILFFLFSHFFTSEVLCLGTLIFIRVEKILTWPFTVYIVSSLFIHLIILYLINLLNFESWIMMPSESKAFPTDRLVLGPSGLDQTVWSGFQIILYMTQGKILLWIRTKQIKFQSLNDFICGTDLNFDVADILFVKDKNKSF